MNGSKKELSPILVSSLLSFFCMAFPQFAVSAPDLVAHFGSDSNARKLRVKKIVRPGAIRTRAESEAGNFGHGWALRSNVDKRNSNLACLDYNGQEVVCEMYGFFLAGFSKDFAKAVFFIKGGSLPPKPGSVLFFEGGRLKKKVEFSHGILAKSSEEGNLVGVLSRSPSGAAIRVFDYSGTPQWEESFPGEDIASWEMGKIHVSRDGARVVAATDSTRRSPGKIRVFDGRGKKVSELSSDSTRFIVSPDDGWIAFGGRRHIGIHDIRKGKTTSESVFPSEANVHYSADSISSDSKKLLISKTEVGLPREGKPARFSKVIVVDFDTGAAEEVDLDEKVERGDRIRWVSPLSFEVDSPNRKLEYEISEN